ncbi:MAG: plasmid mobilization relaxosome protein MobC [Lachnospiraceae bacterium]|nr:plasmid mobilization relaxosome protein MobC [Lachnospiraceae bacterium]
MGRLNEKLKFRISAEEVERIKVKMEDAGIMSMSAYIRKMALDGICVRMDLADVRQLVILLRRCSNNLEQYARKANETGNVYAAEIENLQNRLDEIWELTRQSLVWLAAIR